MLLFPVVCVTSSYSQHSRDIITDVALYTLFTSPLFAFVPPLLSPVALRSLMVCVSVQFILCSCSCSFLWCASVSREVFRLLLLFHNLWPSVQVCTASPMYSAAQFSYIHLYTRGYARSTSVSSLSAVLNIGTWIPRSGHAACYVATCTEHMLLSLLSLHARGDCIRDSGIL